jgi:membrane protease YdiL (CAAX protease family)
MLEMAIAATGSLVRQMGEPMRWVPPPGWPQPPAGWRPDPGWHPDPTWPPAPVYWQFWWESGTRRRKGFRGWLTSMLPPVPPVARYRPRTAPSGSIEALPRPKWRYWLEALGVYALFFGSGVVAAVLYSGGQLADPASSTSSIADDVLQGLSRLTNAALAVIVVIALSWFRGVRPSELGLAPRWATRRGYRWQAIGAGLIFIGALVVVGILLHLVSPGAHYPFLEPSPWHLLYEFPAAISAGVVEELVVVAFFVTVLEQARTPIWIIYAVGIAIRLSYHVYYGPGVIVFALWAAAAIWLFRRTRRITPLIIAHVTWDAVGSFFHEVPNPPVLIDSLYGLLILGVLIMVVVRAIQIAARGHRAQHPVNRVWQEPSLRDREAIPLNSDGIHS